MKRFFEKLIVFILFGVFIGVAVNNLFPYETRRVIDYVKGNFIKVSNENVVFLKKQQDSDLFDIDVKINNVEMTFILDTGCSSMFISKVELLYLKRRGIITDDDYIGETTSMNADGDTSKCDLYNIKELEIGGYVIKNVTCAVSNEEDALLLIGQSVLSKFSTIIINYHNNTLELKE